MNVFEQGEATNFFFDGTFELLRLTVQIRFPENENARERDDVRDDAREGTKASRIFWPSFKPGFFDYASNLRRKQSNDVLGKRCLTRKE
mmetsp:Transcript_1261/g.1925  ORF Transcript_1261/g.1925 Transcript_1261/m.1925 type:complete len:89 (+) Transcript_1261:2146-2412(+)